MLSWIGRFCGISLGLALLIVFIVWLIFQPKGEVVAHLDRVDSDLRQKAEEIFTSSQPISYKILEDRAFIAKLFEDPSASNVNILDQRYKDPKNVSEALDIDLEFSLEQDGWKANIKFIADPILNQLYYFFGLVDYDLVFFSFNEASQLFQADVQLQPTSQPRRLIPAMSHGTTDTLARQIAEYLVSVASQPGLLRQIWRNVKGTCEQELCADGLPLNGNSLSHTREGYALLYLGPSHPFCNSENRTPNNECAVSEATKRLEMAINEDENNFVAQFGRGIASLKRARSLVRDGHSEYEVGDAIIDAITSLLNSIKANEVFAHKIENNEFGKFLPQDEAEEIDLSTEFIKTSDHYLEARSSLQPANYKKTLEEIKKIKDPPKYIMGHIKSIELTALLFSAKDSAIAEPYLHELQSEDLHDSMGEWLWNYLNGYFLCYWHPDDAELVNQALSLLDRAEQDHLPIGIGRRDAILRVNAARAYCLARAGRPDEALQIIGTFFQDKVGTVETIKSRSFSNIQEEDERLYLSDALLALGEVFVAMSDYKKATIVLQKAIEADPGWAEFVGRSPIFAKYRRTSEYKAVQ